MKLGICLETKKDVYLYIPFKSIVMIEREYREGKGILAESGYFTQITYLLDNTLNKIYRPDETGELLNELLASCRENFWDIDFKTKIKPKNFYE